MKRRLFVMFLALVVIMVLTACSDQTPGTAGSDMTSDNAGSVDSGSSGGKPQVKITYFNTSAEVNTMFEDMFKRYNELFPNVIIELIPTGIGEGQQEKLQSLYASGNAPTFMNVDPANVIEYEDHLLEFTEENASWLSLAVMELLMEEHLEEKFLELRGVYRVTPCFTTKSRQ